MVKTSIGGGKNLEYDEALLIQELKQGSIKNLQKKVATPEGMATFHTFL